MNATPSQAEKKKEKVTVISSLEYYWRTTSNALDDNMLILLAAKFISENPDKKQFMEKRRKEGVKKYERMEPKLMSEMMDYSLKNASESYDMARELSQNVIFRHNPATLNYEFFIK